MRHQTSVFIGIGVASLAILLLLGGFSATAFAQGGTGTITGTVIDPKGLSVPDAKVSVLNTETGIDRSLATTDAGVYTATFLQPGHYQVSVAKDGFSTWVRKDLTLQVGQTLTIDAPLTVGTSVSQVTVTGEAPLIEPDRTEQSQTVTQNQVDGLPMVARRWENFVLLTPAVTTDGTSGLSSFRGISGLYNGNSVDGANNTQAFFSEARGRAIIVSYVYSPDSIREFEVSASNYSAEFGQAAGGVVNAVTKSGTNDLHGDLFWNLRYPDLNALDPRTKVRTVNQQNQYGGSVGAPLIKDKLFFFGTYDGFRKVNPISYTSTNLGGDIATIKSTLGGYSCPASVVDPAVCTAVKNGGVTQNGNGGTHERFFIANWNTTFSINKLNQPRSQFVPDFAFASIT